MRLIDRIQFGPFSTRYHSTLVSAEFVASLSSYFDAELVPQLDEPIDDADGSLTATFDSERFCGSNSLIRNIFTLELSTFGPDGSSEMEADIEFCPENCTFTPRFGHGHYFYLWTPSRKQAREAENVLIQRLVDDYRCTHQVGMKCPICQGSVSGIDNPRTLDVRCIDQRCFVYNFHKDEDGNMAHGHFFTKHPSLRA